MSQTLEFECKSCSKKFYTRVDIIQKQMLANKKEVSVNCTCGSGCKINGLVEGKAETVLRDSQFQFGKSMSESSVSKAQQRFDEQGEGVRWATKPTPKLASRSFRSSLFIYTLLAAAILIIPIILHKGSGIWLDTASENSISSIRVTTQSLNLRACPNINCDVIARAGLGEVFIELDRTDGWVKVDFDKVEVWLSEKYVEPLEN